MPHATDGLREQIGTDVTAFRRAGRVVTTVPQGATGDSASVIGSEGKLERLFGRRVRSVRLSSCSCSLGASGSRSSEPYAGPVGLTRVRVTGQCGARWTFLAVFATGERTCQGRDRGSGARCASRESDAERVPQRRGSVRVVACTM